MSMMPPRPPKRSPSSKKWWVVAAIAGGMLVGAPVAYGAGWLSALGPVHRALQHATPSSVLPSSSSSRSRTTHKTVPSASASPSKSASTPPSHSVSSPPSSQSPTSSSPSQTTTSSSPSASPSPSVNWSQIELQSDPAIYAMGDGHDTIFNLYAAQPLFVGTGFQMVQPDGQTAEYTAGHMLAVQTNAGTWKRWGQLSLSATGATSGGVHTNWFMPSNTFFWPVADVAVSTDVPAVSSAQPGDLGTTKGPVPVITQSLTLGNYHNLAVGAPLLDLGNYAGLWYAHGFPSPVAHRGTFLGVVHNMSESPNSSGWPGTTFPTALAIRINAHGGDSGSPVLDSNGHVVGVFVSYNQTTSTGYAIPLHPSNGYPVGGGQSVPFNGG